MKDNFTSFEESGLTREKWLECYSFHLECKFQRAKQAAKITNPAIYDKLVEAARSVGYAITVHGSRARDVDIVAIPWTEDAVDSDTLVKTLVAAGPEVTIVRGQGENKPHGRIAFVISTMGTYIDLSIMPRIEKNETSRSD